MDGPAVGRLHQDFDPIVGQLFDMAGGQRCPPLPGVDVLAADGHHSPVVLVAPLTSHGAGLPPALQTEESQHGYSRPAQDKDRRRRLRTTMMTEQTQQQHQQLACPAAGAASTSTFSPQH